VPIPLALGLPFLGQPGIALLAGMPETAVDLNNCLGWQEKIHMALTDRRLLAIGDLVFLQPLGYLFLITGPLRRRYAGA